MSKDKIKPFFVKNAINSCYIDSLLVALFFSPSINDSLLKKDIAKDIIYLQEYIKINFIEKIRQNISIDDEIVNIIRNLCVENGWKIDYYDQQNICEFYFFLMDKLEAQLIELKNGDRASLVTLSLENNTKETSIKNILNNTQNITLNNYPDLLVFYLDRFDKIERNTINILIQKRISPFEKQFLIHKPIWEFHSAICHQGDNLREGHYYSLIYHNNNYYIFDDFMIPCFREIKMNDENVTNMIKKDCILIFYKYVS